MEKTEIHLQYVQEKDGQHLLFDLHGSGKRLFFLLAEAMLYHEEFEELLLETVATYKTEKIKMKKVLEEVKKKNKSC